MARDLAIFADPGVLLNFHKGAYFGAVADCAAIEIDELRQLHLLA